MIKGVAKVATSSEALQEVEQYLEASDALLLVNIYCLLELNMR